MAAVIDPPAETAATEVQQASANPQRRTFPWASTAAILLVAMAAVLVGWRTIGRQQIDGHDQAHHVMDGIFFADAMVDMPLDRLGSYPFEYYAQYPALGFVFWPPLFPAIEGVFFRIGGLDLAVAQTCLLTFGVALAVLFYLSLRPAVGRLFAVLAIALFVTTPIIAEHYNTVMLEIPTLAVALLTIVLYQRVVRRGHWRGAGEVVLWSAVAAGSVYTKQTIVFLYPALLLDVLVNHRNLLRQRGTWAAAGLTILFCIPLALFTLKFGQANIAQSIGNQGNIYVAEHKGPSRWSIEGWTYYAREMADYVSPLLYVLAGVAIIWAMLSSDFRRRHGVWLAWLACWYVLFAIFDNKQPRFLVFGIPAVIALAAAAVAAIAEARQFWLRPMICMLAVVTLLQSYDVYAWQPRDFEGVEPVITKIMAEDRPGNIAHFGDHRQLFVPCLRMQDEAREKFMLQGTDIQKVSGSLADACRDYRVRWILVETNRMPEELKKDVLRQLHRGEFKHLRDETVSAWYVTVDMEVYEYTGPVAAEMKAVPLESEI